MATLSDILASQDSLVQEAAEALPFSFSQCTYSQGHIRQALYYCLTCAEPRGICSACSVACHTDHEQVELFPKRNFRCDCPTTSLPHPCTLHSNREEPNTGNSYNHNFHGKFCRCGREYDAHNEVETMIQCLACEDWFHESCLNLRERPTSRQATPQPEGQAEEAATGDENEDAASDASSSGLPPPLITALQYEAMVCRECVRKVNTLRRWAGTPGVLMIVRTQAGSPWTVIGQSTEDDEVNVDVEPGVEPLPGQKRSRPLSGSLESQSKRSRVELNASPSSSSLTTSCLAPPVDERAAAIFAALDTNQDPLESLQTQGSGDIFLTEGFRDRWCKCEKCLPSLEANSFLLQEEETYEPPEDPDSGLSLEELGMRALARIPRDRAIDGIHAFNELRDQLMSHLRPFAQEDKEVTEADIRAFFAEKIVSKDK